jgi:hypothetical protein
MRMIATYAVVILHADGGIKADSPTWSFLTKLADFAVPFFLLTSFFLTLRSVTQKSQTYRWQSRITRLMIPFLAWSLIYLVWRIVRYALNGQLNQVKDVVGQIPALFILGQAGFAFHLYFLPLLIIGNLVIMLSAGVIHRFNRPIIWLTLTGISLFIYQYSVDYLFSIKDVLRDSTGWQYYLFYLLGYLCRCLPYIAIARLLIYPKVIEYIQSWRLPQIGLSIGCFLFISLATLPLIPITVIELLKAIFLLLIALSLSNYVKANPLISSLSTCSYGIYLNHILFLDLLWSILQRFGFRAEQRQAASWILLLFVATVSFLVAWLTTAVLFKQKRIAKLLFGI